jgi:FkbM family methyltransferase
MPKQVLYKNRHGREFLANQHEVFDRSANGIYQVTSLRCLRNLAPNARRILDVGANVGIMSMEYATWCQNVEAFECQADTLQMLRWNIQHNIGLPIGQPWYNNTSTKITGNITVHPVALMHITGQAYITERRDGLASYVKMDSGHQPTPTTTVDSFGWTDVDAIKLDTEGTEWLIVQGADQTIRQCRPVVQVEIWGWERRFGLDNQHMLDYFRNLNYSQIDAYGRTIPWDAVGPWTKKLGNGRSAMDRFFVPN